MKKLIILLALVIAGGAFWFLTSDKLNVFIAEQIEVQGSKFTEQRVTVEKVDIQLLHGASTIKGLLLNNPKGYSSTPAFSLDEITLDINLASLAAVKDGKPIVIDAIVINEPEALVEFNATGGSNIQEILDAIDRNIPKSSTKEGNTDSVSASAENPKIRVKQFILAGVALRVDLTKLGNTTHKKTLTDINLTNIGGKAGLPANELGGELVKRALSAIWKSAKKDQQRIVEDKLKDKAKEKVSKLLGDLLN